jgi:hypothetical protein
VLCIQTSRQRFTAATGGKLISGLTRKSLPAQPAPATLRSLAGSILSAEMGPAHRSVNNN